jgi:hypothetical protein
MLDSVFKMFGNIHSLGESVLIFLLSIGTVESLVFIVPCVGELGGVKFVWFEELDEACSF